MKISKLWIFLLVLFSCNSDDDPVITPDILQLQSVKVGTIDLPQEQQINDLPIDKAVFATFNLRLDRASVPNNFIIKDESGQQITLNFQYLNEDRTVSAIPENDLLNNTLYTIELGNLRAVTGEEFPGATYSFRTEMGSFAVESLSIDGKDLRSSIRVQNVDQDFEIKAVFSHPLNPSTQFAEFINISGKSGSLDLNYHLSEDQKNLTLSPAGKVSDLAKYTFSISPELISSEGLTFPGLSSIFYTIVDSSLKFPEISDQALLTLVQEQTFRYFWDFGHPASGMARERNSSGDLVTIGGSGFGVMAILAGIERGFITRSEGMNRLEKIINFLITADRFHGVWPHWLNGNTGKVIPFSEKDDGGDLVETAFMIQGLLTVRQYLNNSNAQESSIIDAINQLWEEVEWDWYTRGGENVLYWHWSPNYGWEMNHQIRGWNEALIVYVLAASSPTHSIDPQVYHQGWALSGGMANGKTFFEINLPLGEDYGGPLFFAHYSFLGLDPRTLEDQYANYWNQNVNHSLINREYAIHNPHHFVGYGENSWGFTASDNHQGYSAHSPTNDLGVITPTAALSSIPYTPVESMAALKHFYYIMGDRLWGEYGFFDAFNPTEEWVANSFLAIDQGPIIIMIENFQTGLFWNLFMSNPEISAGLEKLGFVY